MKIPPSMCNMYLFILINTDIPQGCIKLIKSNSKDIYIVTKDSYLKKYRSL